MQEFISLLDSGLLAVSFALLPALVAYARDRLLPSLVAFPVCLCLGLFAGKVGVVLALLVAASATVWAAGPRRVRVWSRPKSAGAAG
jgi:hypothetical protein